MREIVVALILTLFAVPAVAGEWTTLIFSTIAVETVKVPETIKVPKTAILEIFDLDDMYKAPIPDSCATGDCPVKQPVSRSRFRLFRLSR